MCPEFGILSVVVGGEVAPQRLKPFPYMFLIGTTEVVPFPVVVFAVIQVRPALDQVGRLRLLSRERTVK